MQNKERLQKKIAELQKQWDLLTEKLSKLEKARIIEANAEVKFQLEKTIAENTSELEHIERQLHEQETQLQQRKKPFLRIGGWFLAAILFGGFFMLPGVKAKVEEWLTPVHTVTPTPEQVSKGEEFTFETVTVDAKGQIIKRTNGMAYQYIEDLGNGVKLEMVSVPGGTFLMGSPANEEGSSDDERS